MIVCNTGPLIALSRIGQIDLLERYFRKICIPKEVYKEVCIKGMGKPGAKEIKQANWIEIREVKDVFTVEVLELKLNKGEAEVIVLAKQVKAELVIIDERIPREMIEALGFRVIGTVGILIKAAQEGYLNIREYLDKLRNKGFWLSDEVYYKVLSFLEEKIF